MANQFLNKSRQQRETPETSDALYDAADATMASGGYANKTGKSSARASAPAPTSFSLTEADRARLTQLQGELMTTGRSASKTDLIRVALAALEATPAEQRTRLFDDLG